MHARMYRYNDVWTRLGNGTVGRELGPNNHSGCAREVQAFCSYIVACVACPFEIVFRRLRQIAATTRQTAEGSDCS